MKYTVSKISNQSGLAVQTIRSYADRGMLSTDKRDGNLYRYFDANAVNQVSAIRRLRMMGFTLGEVEEIMTSASQSRYMEMLGELTERKRESLRYEEDVLAFLTEYENGLSRYRTVFNQGQIIETLDCYCLDYRKNGELMCQSEVDQALLNEWMGHSVFLRNYSPYPKTLLYGGDADHVIGFLIEARYAHYVRVSPPVRIRHGGRFACFHIWHDDDMHLLPDGPGFVLRFLEENALEIKGEPFFVGEIPFFEEGEKRFFGRLFVPI